MFLIDSIFIIMLVVLIGLPFASIYPTFERFPYELFYSALGAASIVVLAWERIAHSRRIHLRLLMKRTYYDGREVKLYETLQSISNYVRGWHGLSGEESKKIQGTLSTLKRAGYFRGVDRLYPDKTEKELETLSEWLDEYRKDWDQWRNRIIDIEKKCTSPLGELIRAMSKGQVELREEGGRFIPYIKGSMSRAEAYPLVELEPGRKALALVVELQQTSSFIQMWRDSFWRREILERASEIRDSFNRFLEAHGLEPPPSSGEDWVEGGGVLDRTGPTI